MHGNLIFPLMQQGFYIKFPDPMHVIRSACRLTVYKYLSQRIQPLAAQQNGIAFEQRRLCRKYTAVPEFMFHQL